MKFYIKAFITAVCMAISICNVQAKSKDNKAVYAFVYGTCFNDSIVYISSIERLSNTAIDKKTNFLNDRSNYTNAFKSYLDNKYQEPHTCAIFYATKRDNIEKKYVKIRHNVTKDKHCRLVEIPATDFKISSANISTEQ